ncbi:MAG: IclR family transcriptional regulator domain-containing protein, partial [Chloroflexota bacterium]
MQNYAQRVPAVEKTLAILGYLRQAHASPTLTELSQALGLNRSTALAILNTLRAAGWVARGVGDGYHLGASLCAYGTTAAVTASWAVAADEPCRRLVERLRETVALAQLVGDQVAVVDCRPGQYAVVARPELGAPRPALLSAAGRALLAALADVELEAWLAGRAELVEHPAAIPALDWLELVRSRGYAVARGEGERGLVSIAAAVRGSTGQPLCALCLMGPEYRLAEVDTATYGAAVLEAADQASTALGWAGNARSLAEAPSGSTWRGSHHAGLQGEELEAYLAQPWVASLACLNEDGYPYTVPVWYEWRAGNVWLVPRPRARWVAYLRQHPRVSMTISEPTPPFRRVLVEGEAEVLETSSQAATAMEGRLARRYLG